MNNAGLKLPLPITGNSLLKDADPILQSILHYTVAALITDLQDRWAVAANAAKLPVEQHKIVGQPTHISLFNYGIDASVKFPLLSVNRIGTSYQKQTSQDTTTAKLQLTFVLPPLTPHQANQLEPILHAVEQCVFYRTVENPFLTSAGIRSISIASQDTDYARFELSSNQIFPAITMYLDVVSNIVPTSHLNLKPLEGIDMSYFESSSDDDILMVQTTNNYSQDSE